MVGLYVSVTPDGIIKRHLSTFVREVPLEDVTVSAELITLADRKFWQLCAFIKDVLLVTFDSGNYEKGADYLKKADAHYLSEVQATDPVYALLTELLIADSTRNRKSKYNVIYEIVDCLRSPISVQLLTMDVLESLCANTPIQDLPNYPVIQKLTIPTVHTLGDTVTVQHVFRSYEQYYSFLLQQFIASKPNIVKCQYCGGYFIPKTKRKTLYCDRIIRDGKTCKQIAPGENHKRLAAANRVIAEFDHSKNRMRRRLERTGIDKKPSPIDITDERFCLWQSKATYAKKRYLAGELAEAEAMAIIHVPKKDELPECIPAELAHET